jgi:hypothetical protein
VGDVTDITEAPTRRIKPKGEPPRYAKICGATKPNGDPCAHAPGWGTDHAGTGRCKYHCGATPTGKKSAQTEQARQAATTFGLPIETTPQAALVDEIHRTAGHVAWLGDQVQQLSVGQLTGEWHTRGAVLTALYETERKHLVRVCSEAIKCGVAEAQVRFAEAQGALLAEAVRAILTELEVINDPRAPEVVYKHLRAIA